MGLKNIKQAFVDTVERKLEGGMKVSPTEMKKYNAWKKDLEGK